jgi:hypothetical protein
MPILEKALMFYLSVISSSAPDAKYPNTSGRRLFFARISKS